MPPPLHKHDQITPLLYYYIMLRQICGPLAQYFPTFFSPIVPGKESVFVGYRVGKNDMPVFRNSIIVTSSHETKKFLQTVTA